MKAHNGHCRSVSEFYIDETLIDGFFKANQVPPHKEMFKNQSVVLNLDTYNNAFKTMKCKVIGFDLKRKILILECYPIVQVE